VATLGQLRALRCDVHFLPSGVDLARFKPALPEEKAFLRRKYGLPAEDYLALHIGHLKRSRNVGVLSEIRDQARLVLVAGRSEGYDSVLRRRLQEEGVIVIDTYLKDVEEIYQACDCYLFPVEAPGQAIDIPLSVLEAMACNLPVIAYPFGGLPLLFRKGPGFWFAADLEQVRSGLVQAKRQTDCDTRAMVEPYSWERVAAIFLAAMEGTGSTSERTSAYAR
jgi:glycosyltransferase involved in cell wall biosynthesis